MKIHTACPNCKNEESIQTWSQTRVDLAREKGEEISITCSRCNQTNKVPVDAFRAKKSQLAAIVSLLIFLGGTFSLLFFLLPFVMDTGNYGAYWIIADFALPGAVFTILTYQENQRVSSFNHSKLKGRIGSIKF